MEAREKAKELFDKYEDYVRVYNDDTPRLDMQKQCALIAVDEMLGEYQSMSDLESKIVINDEVRYIVHQLQYWMLVKQEIQNL